MITPRICGICSTSQLYAATAALEMAYQAPVAPNGIRIRNLCLMAESVMSDARQSFLMFAPDFCNTVYSSHALYDQVMQLFEPPFKGSIARQTVQYSKHILGIIIAFGGQWPHSTYMLPGGITSPLHKQDLEQALATIDAYTGWYEKTILGCTSECWLALRTTEDFDAWLEASADHNKSVVGIFTRFGRSIGLPQTGRGTPHLLSAGCYYDPDKWHPPFQERQCLQPAGFYKATHTLSSPSHTLILPSMSAILGLSPLAVAAIRGRARPGPPTPPTASNTAMPKRPGTRIKSCNSAPSPTW